MARPRGGDAPGRAEIVDVVLGFVEVATHLLLFVRGVYPKDLFERRKEYNMAVWMSRHPSLNASISDALVALRPHLMRGVVEAVIVALLDQAGAVVEQYAFDVDVDAAVDVAATYSDVETLLASALTRIALLEAAMLPVPRGTTFTLLVATHDALQGPQSDADEGAGAAGAGGGGTGVLGAGSGWSRVDPGDPEAALTLLGGGAGGGGADATEPVSAALKTIRAGRMAIDVRLVHRR